MQAGVITDADMIFFYMSMLDYLKPGKVLDVGMFLKRAGFVSRQAMSEEISERIFLCGVDLFPDQQFAVYEKIYDVIISREVFSEEIKNAAIKRDERYDVAILLGSDWIFSELEEQSLFSYLRRLSAGVMTEVETAERLIRMGAAGGYQPVSTGAKNFAWIPAMG